MKSRTAITKKTAKKPAKSAAQATTKIIRKALSPKIAAAAAKRDAKATAKPAAKPLPILVPPPAPKPALLEQHAIAADRTQLVDLEAITAKGMQLRVSTDSDAVERYAEIYRSGQHMPPIVVFDNHTYEKEIPSDGCQYFLADGHHRVAAARKVGLAELHAIVKRGDRRDAILYAARANAQHGVPITNADKNHIVSVLLADPEWRQWSDRAIAEAAHVSGALVGKIRKTLPADQQTTVRKSKDGGVRETKNIGKKPRDKTAKIGVFIDVNAVNSALELIQSARPNLAPIKCRILACLTQVVGNKGISRDDLTAAVGYPLDVHVGQLRRDYLVTTDEVGLISLGAEGEKLIDEISGVTDKDRAEEAEWDRDMHDTGETPSGFDRITPEGQQPDVKPHPVATEPITLTAADIEPLPLDQRRAQHVHDLLAEKLAKDKLICTANQRQLLALALVVGISVQANDPAWSDDMVEDCWDILAERARDETIYRLHFHDTARLPPLKLLAGWWGLKVEDLAIIAERAIPE